MRPIVTRIARSGLRMSLVVATAVPVLGACGAGSITPSKEPPDAAPLQDAHQDSRDGGPNNPDTSVPGPDARADARDAGQPGTDARADAHDAGQPGTDARADAPAGDLVQQLQAVTAGCTVASNGKYATDDGEAATIDICRLNGAFYWKADMDIDCDGQTTTECNSSTDPWYQNQTSFTQSNGQPLIASELPYVVVPLPSSRFDYQASGIEPGAACVVIYNGQMSYGVFGDEGPNQIIGEASYAMAASLGIDPDPATGGVDSGVTFIVFTGQGAVVSPIESHQAAATLGQQLAETLVANN